MSDFKDRMIEAYERGQCGYYDAYDYVREQDAEAADLARKRAQEVEPSPDWPIETERELEQRRLIGEESLMRSEVLIIGLPAAMKDDT